MQTWKMQETGKVEPQEIELAKFAELINQPTPRWRGLPYRITTAGNTVTRIEEVYAP